MSAAARPGEADFALREARAGSGLGRLAGVVACFLIAAGAGLGATWLAIENNAGLDAVKAGPWTTWPRNGAPDADPYSRAVVARSGELPLGLGEGLAFTATRDSARRPLVGRCIYRVTGRTPQTRAWTLTVSAPGGRLIPNAARRYGFTSEEIVRDGSGRFTIVMSREARPGNWLPVETEGRVELMLRLYDTPVSAVAAALDPGLLPTIERDGCS